MSISIPNADYTPQLTGYTGQGAFRFWCQKVLPIVYDDSLSYYELLNKVVNYLNNVIADVASVENNIEQLNNSYVSLQNFVNDTNDSIEGEINGFETDMLDRYRTFVQRVTERVDQLQDFVTRYFENLNVQQEINHKLDEMASDGSLTNLVKPIIADEAPDIIEQWMDAHITPTTPIVDGSLSIAGAAADAKVVGSKITSIEDVDGFRQVTFEPNGMITTNVEVGEQVNITPTSNNLTDYAVINCVAGDRFYLTGSGWGSQRLWAFVDSTNHLINKSGSEATLTNGVLLAPVDADKLILNVKKSSEYRCLMHIPELGNFLSGVNFNLTESTAPAFCNSNSNNLVNNIIVGCEPGVISNAPNQSFGGCIITIGKRSDRSNGDTQIFVDNQGYCVARIYSNNQWQTFKPFGDGFIGDTASNNLADTLNGVIAKVSGNKMFTANKDKWNDLPTNDGYIFICKRYADNWDLQTAIRISDNRTYNRITRTDGSGQIYRDWAPTTSVFYTEGEANSFSSSYNHLLSKITGDCVFTANNNYWNDLPSNTGHIIIIKRIGEDWNLQTAVGIGNKNVYTRLTAYSGNGNVYRDWGAIGDAYFGEDEANAFAGNYNNTVAKVVGEMLFTANPNYWNDLPSDTGYIILNRRYTGNWNLQIAIGVGANNIYGRITSHSGNGGIYRDWTPFSGLPNVKILAVGDSICAGARNGGKGFIGGLYLPYKNIAVSGSTLSNVRTSDMPIPDQLANENEYSPDVIIADGGINDYYYNAPLGNVPTVPVSTDAEANALNRNNVLDSLQYLFYLMVKKFPRAQRFFVSIHKVYRNDSWFHGYAPTQPNSAGYTQQNLHDGIVATCKVYGVKVIDVYNESMLNTKFSQYVSPTSYSEDSSVTDNYFVDKDGLHPLALGYKEAYVPLVSAALKLGTKK